MPKQKIIALKTAHYWGIIFLICIFGILVQYELIHADLSSAPDEYENNDSAENATVYYLFSTFPQNHNFHSTEDEDWIKFDVHEDFGSVEIKTFDPEENCETIITLFDSDGTTALKEQRMTLSTGVNLMSFRPEKTDVYYVRIQNKKLNANGNQTGYKLSIYLPIAPFSGTVDGIVSDGLTGAPLEGVNIVIGNNYSAATSQSSGFYFLQGPAGRFRLNASKSGYMDYSAEIEINEIERIELNFSLSAIRSPACKINTVTISDNRGINLPVTFTMETDTNCSPFYYRYSVHAGYGSSGYDGLHWESMTDTEWVPDHSVDYTFTRTGQYIVVVWTTEDPQTVDPNGIPIIGWSVNMNNDVCRTDITGYETTGNHEMNTPVRFAVTATNPCSGMLYYRFSMHPHYGTSGYDGLNWQSMTDTEWIPDHFTDYTFTESGKYIVVVWVTDNPADFSPNGIPIIGWSVDIE